MSFKFTSARFGLIITGLFLSVSFTAQNFCYSDEMQEKWFLLHPELKQKYLEENQKLIQLDAQSRPAAVATAIYTIPVVFHILHTGGVENISDAQVNDAMSILTRDFNKLNADTSNVVGAFKGLVGDVQVEFQLATKDPNGVCTNGIIKHWDANTHVWDGDFSKYLYSWPSNKYLNIYVVRAITFNAAGYTYLPGSGIPPAVDAIVMLSSYVGSIGTSNTGLSRVLTHEVGHWLNLPHPWGWNAIGSTCGDDGVADTPITKGWTSCNLGLAAICTNGVTENVQNYMEYAYCARMFTNGQVNRMQNAIQNPFFNRDELSDPLNLIATGITSPGVNCAPLVDIAALPSATVCSGKSLSLKSFTWNANPSTYAWIASSGVSIANPGSQSTTVTFNNPGTVTITCIVSNSAGNDAESVVVTVRNGSTNVLSSMNESFENPSLALPANWAILNATTPNEKWTLSTLDGINGSKCMYVPGELLSPGSLEMLESPSYDFKNNPGAIFSFKYAYARYSNTHNDVFKVQASRNCGASWTDVWFPGIAGLAAGSGGIDANLFHPTASQWKTYNLTLHPNFIPFLNEENVRIRFYFKEDSTGNGQGNRFYLDDIQFDAPVGIKNLETERGLYVFPNPTEGLIHIQLKSFVGENIDYALCDISGRVLNKGNFSADKNELDFTLNETAALQPGVYLLHISCSDFNTARKIIVK